MCEIQYISFADANTEEPYVAVANKKQRIIIDGSTKDNNTQ